MARFRDAEPPPAGPAEDYDALWAQVVADGRGLTWLEDRQYVLHPLWPRLVEADLIRAMKARFGTFGS